MEADTKERIYGLLAEFGSPEELIEAARKTRKKGYRKIDAHTPFPVHGLAEATGMKGTLLPLIVLVGGICGCLGGFLMQYYASVIDYPYIVGGKPFNSWPSFIPVTFELTILSAAFSAVLGMLALNGLPKPYHPLFNVEEFAQATRDGFFLVVESRDPAFDEVKTREFLESLHPKSLHEVEP